MAFWGTNDLAPFQKQGGPFLIYGFWERIKQQQAILYFGRTRHPFQNWSILDRVSESPLLIYAANCFTT